jgi:hypothetical protein
MDSYSERQMFTKRELALLRAAEVCVRAATDPDPNNPVRCHELARAVARTLDLEASTAVQFQDGYYGHVEHSWLWTTPVDPVRLLRRAAWPTILDVYSVGRLPMVQLVAARPGALPHERGAFTLDDPRDPSDVWGGEVQRLVGEMRGALRLLVRSSPKFLSELQTLERDEGVWLEATR